MFGKNYPAANLNESFCRSLNFFKTSLSFHQRATFEQSKHKISKSIEY